MQFINYAYRPLQKSISEIIKYIKRNFAVDHKFIVAMEERLQLFFHPLRKDIAVFIEYPYVDKIYRDSYYSYFSTKYKKYHRDAFRIIFFEKSISFNDLFGNKDHITLNEAFLGYCIIRPTFPDIVGRNLLKRKAFARTDFITCIHEENIIVNGIKLSLKGFPHSSQDQETITCAETTLWALMEYFGHRYAEYKPVLPSEIIRKLNEQSEKRMLPSNGLTNEQISFALKDFGFGPMSYTLENDKANFLPNLSVYIESGFPVITILQTRGSEYNHAILMIGREKLDNKKMVAYITASRTGPRLIPFHKVVKQYVVQDDNLHPYAIIPMNKPGIHYDAEEPERKYKITAFVVPLYRKMYMDVQKARKVFEEIIREPEFGIKNKEKYIFRMYMCSSRSFKSHIAKQNKIDATLRTFFLGVAMPRFVWCAELINKTDAAQGCVSSLVVLDATEGGEYWRDSFIFAAHKEFSLFYYAVNKTFRLIPLGIPFVGFEMYGENLN